MIGLLLAVFAIFIAIVAGSLQIANVPLRRNVVGILSCASLVSMFASPLFIIVSLVCKLLLVYLLLLDAYFSCSFDFLTLSEFGDSNKECGVYAVLSLTFDLPHERIVFPLWTVQLRSVRLCKHRLTRFLCSIHWIEYVT